MKEHVILIVDDDKDVRDLLRELLAKANRTIYEGANGIEAVAMYNKYSPSIVLMDIRMPGMDGIEAARDIIAIDSNAVIIIVTENNSIVYRKSALEVGAKSYFLKNNLLDVRLYVNQLLN